MIFVLSLILFFGAAILGSAKVAGLACLICAAVLLIKGASKLTFDDLDLF